MFNRASSFALALALPLLAAATALPRNDPSCNTGPIQCCNSLQSSNSPTVTSLAGQLGIVLPATETIVGLGCTPITIGGVGGNSCSSQPVCCSNNEYNGLINIGCTSININL